MRHLESINERNEHYTKEALIKLIIDRAENNIMIKEFTDKEPELDLSAFIKILKNDLKDFQIGKKDD